MQSCMSREVLRRQAFSWDMFSGAVKYTYSYGDTYIGPGRSFLPPSREQVGLAAGGNRYYVCFSCLLEVVVGIEGRAYIFILRTPVMVPRVVSSGGVSSRYRCPLAGWPFLAADDSLLPVGHSFQITLNAPQCYALSQDHVGGPRRASDPPRKTGHQ